MKSEFDCHRNRVELVAITEKMMAKFSARANRHRKDTRERGTRVQADSSSSAPLVVAEQAAVGGIDESYAGFYFIHSSNEFSLYLPDWFLVPLLILFAAAPWMGWSNRFSLRTLLIATTLVAVVLGLIVWQVRR